MSPLSQLTLMVRFHVYSNYCIVILHAICVVTPKYEDKPICEEANVHLQELQQIKRMSRAKDIQRKLHVAMYTMQNN